MTVVISMLRGVNLGPHHRVKMDELRALYEGLGLKDPQTYVQSGNVVFRTKEKNPQKLGARIETAIEHKLGFRPAVILRTPEEMRRTIAQNPFSKRLDINPARLLVTFLATEPTAEARKAVLNLKTDPEEVHLKGRELYVYFPLGISRSKLQLPRIEKGSSCAGTARNWNTVTKLLEIAERLDPKS